MKNEKNEAFGFIAGDIQVVFNLSEYHDGSYLEKIRNLLKGRKSIQGPVGVCWEVGGPIPKEEQDEVTLKILRLINPNIQG